MANEPAACQRERFTRLFGEMVRVGEVVGGIPACVRTNEQIDHNARGTTQLYNVKVHAAPNLQPSIRKKDVNQFTPLE